MIFTGKEIVCETPQMAARIRYLRRNHPVLDPDPALGSWRQEIRWVDLAPILDADKRWTRKYVYHVALALQHKLVVERKARHQADMED